MAALIAGCAPTRLDTPFRGIWVTRFDYKTPEDVSQIVTNCADAGFNAIVFQVRGNATAFYTSSIEPWADELGGRDPGFDPLELACREAHARGVELHAWVNVMPAWRGTRPPENPEQLYHKRPEWFWYDQHGNRQALSAFYVSVNPCLPEVREYLVRVSEEVVAGYDVDGLHLDYIRFPNEPPAIPRGSGLDYPRDARTLALYRQETGKAPDDDVERWNRWRTDCVTRLVGDIRRMVGRRARNPDAALTAAVGSVRENALKHYQDARAWMSRGHVDGVILMNYTDSPDEFSKRLDPWLARPAIDFSPRTPVVPGLWFGRHPGKAAEEAAGAVKRQVQIAHERANSFCVFAYSSLFDSADDAELARQSEAQREVRAARRAVVLPFVRSMQARG